MERVKPILIAALMFMALVVVIAGSQGCSKTAYRTVSASADFYEAAYPAFVEAHKKGLISDADAQKGRDLAVKYWAAYHTTVEMGIAYKAVDSKENADRLQEALIQAQAALSALIEYIIPLLPKGGN